MLDEQKYMKCVCIYIFMFIYVCVVEFVDYISDNSVAASLLLQ